MQENIGHYSAYRSTSSDELPRKILNTRIEPYIFLFGDFNEEYWAYDTNS